MNSKRLHSPNLGLGVLLSLSLSARFQNESPSRARCHPAPEADAETWRGDSHCQRSDRAALGSAASWGGDEA